MSISRRTFLARAAAIGPAFGASLAALATDQKKPRIVLRSSWQTVNIGDIAHTPGVLALLEKHLPQAEVRLWPSNVGDGVEEILRRRFPKVAIVKGADAQKAAFAECDFLLHGSGPSLVAANDVARWRKETGKPYGIYGITLPAADARVIDLISGAAFAYFRETVSLKLARDSGAKCPVMGFAPDGAFAVDLRNDERALKFLADNGLERGKFLCCIPRLRYTPYWKIRGKEMTAEDRRKHEVSEAKKEHDHAPLREAITAVVQKAGMKVLVCPEDQSQMAVGKEMLVDRLPAEIRKSVVWREHYWLTDEALSTYVRSAGLFGNEMHSPIMCVGNGVPAVVCRFAEQTSKGFMWRDIGLGEWLFDHDNEKDRARIAETVLAIATNPEAARAKVKEAQKVVHGRQAETMKVLAGCLSG
jgi:polysaccharide pyruvyl transferase WcaK-like protein